MNWAHSGITEVDKNKIWADRTKKLECRIPLVVTDNVQPSTVDVKNVLTKPVSTRTPRFLDKSEVSMSVIRKFLGTNFDSNHVSLTPRPPASTRTVDDSNTTSLPPLSARSQFDRNVEEVLLRHRMDPSEKYQEPQTSSQEIGWSLPMVKHNNTNNNNSVDPHASLVLGMKSRPGHNHHIKDREHTKWMNQTILNGAMRK
eukprot:PhF_6_TR14971/c0_g1_i2/m.23510